MERQLDLLPSLSHVGTLTLHRNLLAMEVSTQLQEAPTPMTKVSELPGAHSALDFYVIHLAVQMTAEEHTLQARVSTCRGTFYLLAPLQLFFFKHWSHKYQKKGTFSGSQAHVRCVDVDVFLKKECKHWLHKPPQKGTFSGSQVWHTCTCSWRFPKKRGVFQALIAHT